MRGELKPELIESLSKVAEGKNVDSEIVLDSLKEALVTAARKYTGIPKRFNVDIDPETSEIQVLLSVEVVDDYPDYDEESMSAEEVAKLDESYMLLDEALDYNEEAEVGDMLEMEIPIEGFGRMVIQTAKQILLQKVRDAERSRIVRDYQDRIGTIVSGEVQQVDRGNILVKLGKTEAILPAREQIRKERFRQGETIQAYVADVSDSARGAQVILSRAHNQFLAELFKIEVPEIYDGIVEIKTVSRDPGFRAKIAVYTTDGKIDPVGSCVGMKGNRVQSIVRELSNERIDIVLWHEDIETYVRRTLSPAEIRVLQPVEGTTRIVVVVQDEDLSQVIGRSGQNIRLASQLVGRALDIYGESDWLAMSEEERETHLTQKEGDRTLEVDEDAEPTKDKFSELDALFKDS
jgi:N utilization substance protein A